MSSNEIIGTLRSRALKKQGFALDPNVKHMNVTSAIKAAASPYEVMVQEDMSTYDIKIALVDNRQEPPARIVAKIPRAAMTADGMSPEVLMRAVEAAKSRLQEKLARGCDEPEIRLWAAKYRDVDLMDNSEIPSRIRTAYNRDSQPARESVQVEQVATEQSIESDSGPVYDTPPPRARRIVKKRASVSFPRIEGVEPTENNSGESTQNEVKTNVPVATVKGAHSKTPKRKPRCNSRDHDDAPEMEYDPEDGVWKCPEPGCKTIARPKSDSPVGTIQLGKGRLDLRVLFVEPGKKPSILLVADNNIALDITDYVEMDNFLKYSRAVQHAQKASDDGEANVQIDMPAEKYVSAMLKFPGMRIYGCDNA